MNQKANKTEFQKRLRPYTIIMLLLVALTIAIIIVSFTLQTSDAGLLLVVAVVPLVIMFFVGRKRGKIKRSYCPYCGTKYLGEFIQYKWDGGVTSTAKSTKYTYDITCHCANCNKSTTFSKDIVLMKEVDDWTTEHYDAKELIEKLFDL